MRAVIVIAALFLLCSGSSVAAAEPPPDRVYALVGKWTCSSSDKPAHTTTFVATRDGNSVDVVRHVRPATGAPYTAHDRFTYDPSGTWHVEIDAGSPRALQLTGPAWDKTKRDWAAEAHDDSGALVRLSFMAFSGTFMRTVTHQQPLGKTQSWFSDWCASGDASPAQRSCETPNVPPHTVVAAEPSTEGIPQTVRGTVNLIVSLDEDSNIESVSVASSPSALLSAAAVRAARESTFQTMVKSCYAIPGRYLFTVKFGP
jgi:hypothetical protein